MKRDVAIVLSERSLVIIVQLFSNIVLSRLMDASDFGIMAILTVFINFSSLIVDSGIGGSLLFKEKVSHEDYNTAFWFNLTVAIFLYLMLYFCSGFIAFFFGVPNLSYKIKVVGFSVVLTGLGNLLNTLAIREKNFTLIARINVFSVLLSSAISVVLGYFNYGVWSLIIQNLSFNLVMLLGLVFSVKFKPNFVFSFKLLKEHFLFGISLLLSNLVKLVFDFFINSLIARKFSLREVGYFYQAKKVVDIPISILTSSLDRVIFTIFARIRLNVGFNDLFNNLLYLVTLIIVPIAVLLSINSEIVISLLFGRRWAPVIPIFSIMSLSIIPLVYETYTRNILKSKGKVVSILNLEILKRSFAIMFFCMFSDKLEFVEFIIVLILFYFLNMLINVYVTFKEINFGFRVVFNDNICLLVLSFIVLVLQILLNNISNLWLINIWISVFFILSIWLIESKRLKHVLSNIDIM
jgi:O-antigen/teichoic acid export membrane protein